ncbi:MAG: hypothetical protein Q9M92_12870 [Enterobacterales bacterium]|nr:hypothetical protein [Enterobacterales bacterium]
MKSKQKISLVAFALSTIMLGMGTAQAADTLHFLGGCSKTCSGEWHLTQTASGVAYSCHGTITGQTAQCRSVAPTGGNNDTKKIRKTRQVFKANGDDINVAIRSKM